MNNELENKNTIINFVYLNDSKKNKQSLREMDLSFMNTVLDFLKKANHHQCVQVAYYLSKYHLDLFLKSEYFFELAGVFSDPVGVFDRKAYRTSKWRFEEARKFITLLNQSLSEPEPTLKNDKRGSLMSIMDSASPTKLKSKTIKPNLRESLIFSFKTPQISIFKKISPEEFSTSLHKIYTSYFLIMQTREFQYVAKDEDSRNFVSRNKQFKFLLSNLYRKLELEIDIYCKINGLKTLSKYLDECINTLLTLGNTPLATIFMDTISRFSNCDSSYYDSILKKYADSKSQKKYTFLVKPDKLLQLCVWVYSSDKGDPNEKFEDFFKKIEQTKREIGNEKLLEALDGVPTPQDIITFSFMDLYAPIKTALYEAYGANIACLLDRCPVK